MYYIGIDLGTTCCKCILFGDGGKVEYVFNKEMPIDHFGENAEQSASIWLETVLHGLKEIAENNKNRDIVSLSISTQGISFVITDKNFEPLCNAISWLDTRAKTEYGEIISVFSADKIEKVCGLYPLDCYVFPKLLWLKNNKKDLLKKGNRIMTALDFLNARLTGNAVIDFTMAGGTMLLNIDKRNWEKSFLDYVGIDESQLSSLAAMGSYVGELSDEIRKKTGLGKVKVYLGGQDQKLAAIGGGIKENVITVSLGTSTAVSILNEKPNREFKKFIFNENDYIYEAALSTTGASIRWLKEILGCDSYEEMDELAEKAGSSDGLSFSADFIDGAKICGLKLGHCKGNIIYSLYEGIAEQIKHLTDNLDDKYGVRLFGGGAKSKILCNIIEKTVGRKIYRSDMVETAAYGAAVIAANGVKNGTKR